MKSGRFKVLKKLSAILMCGAAAVAGSGFDVLVKDLELLRAPGMEHGVGKSWYWRPMKKVPAGCRLEWSGTGSPATIRSLRIDYTGAARGPAARWVQQARLAGSRGTLQLEGDYRLDAGTNAGRVVLTFVLREPATGKSRNQAVNAVSLGSADARPPMPWRHFSRTLPIPEHAVAVYVALEGFAGADLYFDNIRLIQRGITPAAQNSGRSGSPTLVAPQAADGSITIDGDLSDWKGVEFTRLGQAETYDAAMNVVEDGTSRDELREFGGRFAGQWSDDFFYLCAEVRDRKFPHAFPGREAQYWTSDSIQVAFSPGPERSVEKFAPHDVALAFIPEADGRPQQLCFDTPPPPSATMKKIRFKFRPTPSGYIFEAAIPAGLVTGGGPIAAQSAAGFNLVVNNNDGRGRKWLEWTGGLALPNWPWLSKTRDPSRFGVVVMAKSRRDYLAGYFLKPGGVITDRQVAEIDMTVVAASEIGKVEIKAEIGNGPTKHPFTFTMPVKAGVNRLPLALNTPGLGAGTWTLTASGRAGDRSFTTRCGVEIVPMTANIRRVREQSRVLEAELKKLRGLLARCRSRGQDIRVPDASAAMAEVFTDFACYDVFSPDYNAKATAYLDYCGKLIAGRIAEAEAVLAGKTEYPRQPSWSMKNITIRDGRLWSGDQPVLLNGYCSGKKVECPETFARLGVNVIGFALDPADGMRAVDRPVENYYAEFIRPVQEMCARYNFTSFWLLHHLLKGELKSSLLKQFPRLADGACNFCEYDIDHPAVRELWRNFLAATLPRVTDSSYLFAFDLQNEAEWKRASARTLAKFRRRLEEQYAGDPAALRKHWGPQAPKRFDAIRAYPLPGDPSPGRYYDWCEFNCDRVVDHLSFLKNEIERYLPGKGFSIKIVGEKQFTGTRALDRKTLRHTSHNDGIDREKIARVLSIHGCDVRPVAVSSWGSRPYAFAWLGSAMTFDMMKSLAPQQPIMDNEWHAVDTVFYRNRNIDPDHLRTALWHARLHGLSACILWFWGRGDKVVRNPFFFEGSILEQPWLVEAFSQTNLLHQRLVREISAFAQAERPLALLYSEASAIHDPGYLDELQHAFEGMNFLGLPLRFVTERQLRESRTDGIRLIVVPDAGYVEDATVKALGEAAGRGIKVMAAGHKALRFNPWGQKRKTAAENVTRIDGGSAENYFSACRNSLAAAGLKAELTVLDRRNQPVWGIESRTVTDGGERFAYLLNLTPESMTVRLRWNDRAAAPFDLVGRKQVPVELTIPGRGVILMKY